VDLDCGLHAVVEDLRLELTGGSPGDPAAEDHCRLVGAAEGELVGERLLKSGASGDRPIEHAGVRDLQLPEREVVDVAAPAVLVGER